MEDKERVLVGKLNYREIDFDFILEDKILKLITPEDKKIQVLDDMVLCARRYKVDGLTDATAMEESYLSGMCIETGQAIIFLTEKGSQISFENTTLFISLRGYILFDGDTACSIDGMSFNGPEIDSIYSTQKGYECNFDEEDFYQNGIFSFQTKPYSISDSKKHSFTTDGKNVEFSFNISRKISYQVLKPPVEIHSSLRFHFEETQDYTFLIRLWYVAKAFLSYLCYRKSITFDSVQLYTIVQEGKRRRIATLHMVKDDTLVDTEPLKKGKFIKHEWIEGFESEIFSEISNQSLYLNHLPKTYLSGKTKDEASFIMITSAFEWEFRQTYPDGLPKKGSTIAVEDEVRSAIQALIDRTSGPVKKKYKFLLKLITASSLKEELIKVCNDFEDIAGDFGRYLYRLNGKVLNYTEMGERLASQRNNFAHGNLDKEFDVDSLLDLSFLEYLVYAMQLKRIGISKENIHHALDALF